MKASWEFKAGSTDYKETYPITYKKVKVPSGYASVVKKQQASIPICHVYNADLGVLTFVPLGYMR